MADSTNREHFIPIRVNELTDLLGEELPAAERHQFDAFARLVGAVFHYEYHDRLLALKEAYAPFDPDGEIRTLIEPSEEERESRRDQLFDDCVELMERANFQRLGQDVILEAVEGGASRWGINMDVDFDLFERLEVFARGDAIGRRSHRHSILFWRVEEHDVPVYQRLVLVMKLRQHERLPAGINTDGIYLKLFKDIPKLDLEMLLPGARLTMPGLQRLKLGGSLLSSVAFVMYKVSTEIGNLALALMQHNPLAFWGPLSLVFGYGYRQYAGYMTAKQTYSSMLTESLYYQNLDNNAGVVTRLLDEAEDQECRETFLAYHALWRDPRPHGWTAEELDRHLEHEIERRTGLIVDFEIYDALAKLERLGLVERTGGDQWHAVAIELALERLDYAWDNYFAFNDESTQPRRDRHHARHGRAFTTVSSSSVERSPAPVSASPADAHRAS